MLRIFPENRDNLLENDLLKSAKNWKDYFDLRESKQKLKLKKIYKLCKREIF